MDTTAPPPWHLVVEFVGVDLDDDDVLDALISDPACHIMWSSSEGITTAEALIAAETFEQALDTVLDAAGSATPEARVIRLVDPLVTISDIADEAGVTRQAVRNWALGARQSGFPRPLDIVGDGVRVWRRADVDQWLTEAVNLGTRHRFPSAEAIAIQNTALRETTAATTDDGVNGEDEDGWVEAFVISESQDERIERRPPAIPLHPRATTTGRR